MDKLILLVDDERANIFALEVILESNGYQVESCGSGREALELVGTGKYGLVLLDVMMPEMDGYETCRAIRAATDDVPVILVTALSDSEDLVRGFDAGAIDYIRKPIDAVELLARVRNTLRIRESEEKIRSLYSAVMQDLEVASTTQTFMLPRQFVLEDRLVFCSEYTPSTKIGGDLFDIIKLSQDKYFIYIADISGHGIQAALLMSAVKSMIHMTVEGEDPGTGVSTVFNHINSLVCNGLFRKNYMTMLGGMVDLAENTFRYFNAGHPPIICYDSKERKAEILDSKGSVPVGWKAEIEYLPEEEGCIGLDCNKTILLYTDGIIECGRTDDDQLGVEGFAHALEEAVGGDGCLLTPHKVKQFLMERGYDMTKDDSSMFAFERSYEADRRLLLDLKSVSDEMDRRGETSVKKGIELIGAVSRIGSMCEQKIIEWTGDKELAARIEIVTNEQLNNIVIHGLQGKCDSVVVELSMDEAVRIRFFDQGVAWEPAVVSTHGGEVFAADRKYAESGRGLKMIQSLASSFEHNRYDGLNETVIEVARG